jgi:hypothetical protein
MATIVSSFAVLFLVSFVTLVGADDNNNNVKKTCIDTPFPETCVSTLSSFSESKDADARSMVGIMVYPTMNSFETADNTAIAQTKAALSDEDSRCFKSCEDELFEAYRKLDAVYGNDFDDVKLTELHSFFEEAKKKRIVWNCDRCLHGEMKKKLADISAGNEAEKRMVVLSTLVDRATK